jgi:hypothetical protein
MQPQEEDVAHIIQQIPQHTAQEILQEMIQIVVL